MKCSYKEFDPLTSASSYFNVAITIEPETMQESFELGTLAIRLRSHDIWCIFDQDKPSLTMQVRGKF